MQCEELSAREEFTYSHMPTLERGGDGSLGRRGTRGSMDRRGERYKPERDSYTVDVRASDLQLDQPEPRKHPCFSYRAWLYSVLIGVRGRFLVVAEGTESTQQRLGPSGRARGVLRNSPH